MVDSLYDRLNMRQMPTSRRSFCAKHVERTANGIGDDEIAQLARACVGHDKQTLELEAQWDESRGQTSRARGNARMVDAEIDELLSNTRDAADAQLTNPNPDISRAAQTFLDAVFPLGVAAVTNQSFEDQLGWLEAMGERFDGKLGEAAEKIAVAEHCRRVVELTGDFATELRKQDDSISFDTVKEARHQGHELLATLAFRILSKYANDANTRQKLMAEFDRQNKLIGQAYRDNRRPAPIDPDSGEPIEEGDDVAPEPAEA